MGAGMSQCGSRDVTVYEGQQNTKEDRLVMFHIGKTTHCLVFRFGVDVEFDIVGDAHALEENNVYVDAKSAHGCRYN